MVMEAQGFAKAMTAIGRSSKIAPNFQPYLAYPLLLRPEGAWQNPINPNP
jgi:hypothetical protein